MRATENGKGQFFSSLFVSYAAPRPHISEAPFPQPTTPPPPQSALLVQGHVLQPLSHKALHVKHAIPCLAFLFGGASPNYRCKLGLGLAAVYVCMGHPPCFLPCLFTDKFYGLSSTERALERIRSAFVAACCCVSWMYRSRLEGNRCDPLYKKRSSKCVGLLQDLQYTVRSLSVL